MKLKHILISVFAGTSMLVASCAPAPKTTAQPNSQQQAQQQGSEESEMPNLPEWVLNPYIEDGLAATSCVIYSGDMATDKSEALALARTDLARQLDLRVAAMEKVYREKTTEGKQSKTAALFKTVSRNLTEARIKGSRPRKTKFVKIEGRNNLCVMVTLGNATELFDKILQKSKVNVNDEEKAQLKKEFNMKKDMKEMDSLLNKKK